MTPDQERKLEIFADWIDVKRNKFTGDWFWWTLGKCGFNSKWWCEQAPAGYRYSDADCDELGLPHGSISVGPATVSLDSLDPRLFALEKGQGAGRTCIVIDARALLQNPHGQNVVLDLAVSGTPTPVFLRLNGMNLEIPIPTPHDQPSTLAFVQRFTQTTKGRPLTDAEANSLGVKFPGPTYTDADREAICAAIDQLP